MDATTLSARTPAERRARRRPLTYNLVGGLSRNMSPGYAPVRLVFGVDNSVPTVAVETLDGSGLPGGAGMPAGEPRRIIARLYSTGWHHAGGEGARLDETWQRAIAAHYARHRANLRAQIEQ